MASQLGFIVAESFSGKVDDAGVAAVGAARHVGVRDAVIDLNRIGDHYVGTAIDLSLYSQDLGTVRFVNLTSANLVVVLDDARKGVESGFDHGYDEFNWSPCGYPANRAGCQHQIWLRDRGVPFVVKNHPETKHGGDPA